jgi:hypothetical protein
MVVHRPVINANGELVYGTSGELIIEPFPYPEQARWDPLGIPKTIWVIDVIVLFLALVNRPVNSTGATGHPVKIPGMGDLNDVLATVLVGLLGSLALSKLIRSEISGCTTLIDILSRALNKRDSN